MSETMANAPPPRKTSRCRPGFIYAAALVAIAAAVTAGVRSRSAAEPGRADASCAACWPGASHSHASINKRGLLLPEERIRAGGPPKDGIPSLVEPETVTVPEADFLDEDDRVVGVVVGGEARAYPIAVLNWHEAVNDVLGSIPIAVVYCPLCDSVGVYDRRLDSRVYEFGISGLLFNSNVLLYDRQDNALWSQAGLQAVSGPNAGRSLRHLPFALTTFGTWRERHPNATVVSFETGHRRAYDHNPYARYFESDGLMFPAEPRDDRLGLKERVVGVKIGGVTRAYPLTVIAAASNGRLEDRFEEGSLVLEMTADEGVRIVELPTGSRAIHTFWFAWAAFHPETDVYGSVVADRPGRPDS